MSVLKRRRSLRTKIIMWSLIPTTVILTAVAVFVFFAYQQVTEDLVIQRDKDLVRLSAGQIALELREYTDLLDDLIRATDISSGDPVALQEVLKGFERRAAAFDGGLLILNTYGQVAAAWPERPDIIGQNWSDRVYFRDVVRTQKPLFSDIVSDGPGGEQVVAVAVPIMGSRDEFQGAVVGMFRLGMPSATSFYDGIVSQRIGEGGHTYVIDRNGRVVYDSSAEYIAQDLSGAAVVQHALSGQPDAIISQDPQGRTVVAGFSPVPGTPWMFVSEETRATLMRSSEGYRQLLLLLLVLGIVLPSVFVALSAGRITKPITELISAAKDVASGKFGQAIWVDTGDEIEELARQFNVMSAELCASYTNMEQRVAARTHELSILLEISRNVASILELEPLLGLILDQLKSVVSYSGASIMVLEGEQLKLLAYRGPISNGDVARLRFPLGKAGANRQVVERREPVIIPDVCADTPMASLFRETAGDELYTTFSYIRSWMGVPLIVRDELIGMISFDHGEPNYYTPAQAQVALAFAAQAAVAIENARLYAEATRRAEENHALYAVQQAIASPLEWDAVLQLIADEARRLTTTRVSAVYLLAGDTLVRSVLSTAEDASPGAAVVPADQTPLGAALRSRRPVLVTDTSLEPHVSQEIVGDTEAESLLAVPLVKDSQPIGIILVADKEAGALDADDERVLSMLASGAVVQLENARLYQEEQTQRHDAEQRRRVAEGLRDILVMLNSTIPLEKTLEFIIEQAARLLGADGGVIYGIDVDRGIGRVQATSGMPEEFLALEDLPLILSDTNRAILRGEPFAVAHFARHMEERREAYAELPPQARRWGEVIGKYFNAYLSVPLIVKEEVFGSISLYHRAPHEFSQDEISLATTFAGQAALAIENGRLFAQAESRMLELEALYRADEELYRHLHVDEVLQALVNVAVDILEADKSALFVWDEGHESLRPRAVCGFQPESVGRMVYRVGEGLVGGAAETGKPVIVEDTHADPRVAAHITEPEGIQAFINVPIKVGGSVFGVFNLSYTREHEFGREEQRLILALAQRAALAIENAQLYERAQQVGTLEERQRLARELHDAVTQTLFSASLIAEVMPRIWDKNPEVGMQRLEELRQLTRGALAEMRTLLLELRPTALVEADLGDLLRQLGEATTGRSRIPVAVTVHSSCDLPDDVQIAFYRIAQEALNNMVKHAGPCQAEVELYCRPRRVQLQVRDTGRGFDADSIAPERLGLGIMRERAAAIGAELTVESVIGEGTVITVMWSGEDQASSLIEGELAAD